MCQVPTETFKTTKMQAEAVCKMKQTETKVDSAIEKQRANGSWKAGRVFSLGVNIFGSGVTLSRV